MPNTEIDSLERLGVTRYILRSSNELESRENPVSVVSMDDWQGLEREVVNCKKCSLCSNRTNAVFGVGDQSADLLLVGEAPGFYEDKQGKPFVGRAGVLLTLMLKSIGFTRDSVYIANVIKCRPENNRDPLPIEIESCTPYLMRQIELLAPKLILALGRYAAHFLLKKSSSLSSLRGELHNMPSSNIPMYVTYHPAYLLRNPKDKKESFQDLIRVKEFLS